jgi:hypothetical protein
MAYCKAKSKSNGSEACFRHVLRFPTWRSSSIRGAAVKFPESFYCNIPVQLELTERDHPRSTPLEQLSSWPIDAATVGNIFGTPFVELLSVPSARVFSVFSILKSSSPLGRLYFWKQPEVIRNQIRGTGWVFSFSNRFLGHKLLERERLVSWSIVIVKNPIVGPKFRPFSTHGFT